MSDPVVSNPEFYSVLFENDRVRVLEYQDAPGDATVPHSHPESVMITLSAFSRRLRGGGSEVDVQMPACQARWLDAQEHSGENTGTTPTHAIFVELKGERTAEPGRAPRLGPSDE